MKSLSSKWLGAIVASVVAVSVVVAGPASAEIVDQQYSPSDTSNETYTNYYYDIESIETGFSGEDSDQIYFWINFKTAITANQFVYGTKHPWAAILIHRTQPSALGGDKDDIRLYTNSSEGYSGNYSIEANAYGNEYAGESRVDLSSCSPETWTNLDTGAKWIGFSISRSCANIPDYFWVTGYVDPDGTNSLRDWDYGPDTAWYVDISGSGDGGYDDSYTEPQYIYFYQSPDILLTKKTTKVTAYADSGLSVYFDTLTPKVCKPVNYTSTIKLLAIGTCKLSADQDGDDYYEAADTKYMSFKVVKAGTRIKPVPKASPTPTVKPTPKKPGNVGGKPKT